MGETLQQIAILRQSMDGLYELRERLVDKAIHQGATWKDISLVDKIKAMQLCHHENPQWSLPEIREIVNNYLADKETFND
jgi:hypothetical protein